MKKILTILLALILLTSCKSIIINEKSLNNKEYVLVNILENGIENNKILNNARIKIRFDDNKLSGISSVNNYFTNFKIKDNKLVLEGLASTKMAGSINMMQLEKLYFSLLQSNLDMQLKENKLILSSDNGISLVYEENKKINLENNKFKLINTEYEKYGIIIEFKDGLISGYSGINRFFGAYKLENNHLYVFNLGNTLKAGDMEIMDFEFYFLKLIQNSPKIKFDGNILEIFDDEEKILKFHKY